MIQLFWIAAGLIFFSLEFFSTRLYAAGLGVAACLTGGLSLFIAPPALQFFAFLFISLLYFSLLRKRCLSFFSRKRGCPPSSFQK
jgi:membrane protein implicated in regulation of membrane protease activity